MNEPSMRDMARAAGWLQDHFGRLTPTAGEVESLSWLIAAAREDDKNEIARLKARILSIDPTNSDAARDLLRELQQELCTPLVATPVQGPEPKQ